jgi:hypothetical protein
VHAYFLFSETSLFVSKRNFSTITELSLCPNDTKIESPFMLIVENRPPASDEILNTCTGLLCVSWKSTRKWKRPVPPPE